MKTAKSSLGVTQTNQFSQAIATIIKEQENIMGPLAIEEAKKVDGLVIKNAREFNIKGNPEKILQNLVMQFAKFFGQASIEVCKDAIKQVKPPIPHSQLPEVLR